MPRVNWKSSQVSYRTGAHRNVPKIQTHVYPRQYYGRFTSKPTGAFGVQLFGDWEEFEQWLGLGSYNYKGEIRYYDVTKFEDKIKAALDKAAQRCVKLLVDEIKRGIKSGAPGGQPFKPLSSGTIALRKEKAAQRGEKAKSWVGANTSGYIKGKKPLLRTGDLYRSITGEVLDNGSFFVGIPRGAKNREGQPLDVIGLVHEQGMVLRVTQKIANWFAAQGVPLKDTTTHIFIPARPFLAPVLKRYRHIIYQIYRDEIDTFLFTVKGYSKKRIKAFLKRKKKITSLSAALQAKTRTRSTTSQKPKTKQQSNVEKVLAPSKGAKLGLQVFVGPEKPSRERFKPITENPGPGWTKPRPKKGGGFWTSTYTGRETISDYVQFVKREGLGFKPGSKAYLLEPDPDARIFEIRSYTDLEALAKKYGIGRGDEFTFDFVKMAQDFDAIHLTREALPEVTNMNKKYSLFGWDTESTLWLNFKVRPYKPNK